MEPEVPSTPTAGPSKDAIRDSGPPASGGVQVAFAPTSAPAPAQLEEQFVFYGPVSGKQCHQLFGATCRVKVQRCQVPVPSTPTVNNAIVEVPSSAEVPPVSSNVREVEKKDATKGSSSSEDDDDIRILATFPPSAASTKKGPVPKKKGKGVSSQTAYCTVCKKTMSSNECLRRHMRKHTGDKRYRCEHCGKRFWNPSSFSMHKKARNERNGVCPRVNQTNRWKPKGSWSCKICGKRLKQAGYYVSHMSTHREEKRFKCGECRKGFGRNCDLSSHKSIHTGIWLINCVFCEKGFNRQANYWSHLRVHTEEQPFFCVVDGCGESFRVYETLKRHRRLVHL